MAPVKPRPIIGEILPYKPGKPIGEVQREYGLERVVQLASNENRLGPSPKALAAIREHLDEIYLYPEGSGYYLVKAIAEKHGLEFNQIILGNGANDIIELVAKTFVNPGENVIYGFPSFIMYEIAVKMVDGECRRVPLKDYRFDLPAMADAMDEKTKVIFIANPNNPTGTIVTKSELDAFLERCNDGVLVVLDEAYFDFVTDAEYPDGTEYLKSGNPIMVIRSFSKNYGLAGLRLGWAAADPETISHIQRIRQPFNCNRLAQVAGVGALTDDEHLARTREMTQEGTKYLYGEFDRLGLEYVRSHANFILVDFGTDIGPLYEKLLKRGFVVRPMAAWGYANSARVTVGTVDENREFINVLEDELQNP
jgi:histidinol-phosphate aminotransferase